MSSLKFCIELLEDGLKLFNISYPQPKINTDYGH
ncbi:hypothetical protein Cyan10605_0548 [Cyanobacterium aponinum PCC 10605]|uniref:Uncharacterized protein n=1 Tax=Cyanobacterium aponinum (strain PCC 10605) TaxID=755178 RepID=K9Z0L0_CYAAP|nr:hypothetical protein Cyan10605_0548 [Cyanobacterium aponinum PCC 10605]